MHDERRARFEREIVVHLRAAYGAAWRLTHDVDRAKDLVQDAMLRAFAAFDTFTAGTNGRAWLLQIVYSVFVNHYRRDQRMPPTTSIEELELRHGFDPTAPSPPPVDPWQPEGWTEPDVIAALAALPDDFRMAVMLVDVEDLTYEDAAAAMGCAVGTVRSRLFRARRLLATTMRAPARRHGWLTTEEGTR